YALHPPHASSSLSLSPLSFPLPLFSLFFFNNPATTEIYTLSLHDALPIFPNPLRISARSPAWQRSEPLGLLWKEFRAVSRRLPRSEEHTSELQSLTNIVCRLLLEKKKKNYNKIACTKNYQHSAAHDRCYHA